MARWRTLKEAAIYLGGRFSRELTALRTDAERRIFLTKVIDLDWFPDSIADRLDHDNDAWRRFLNQIIDESTGGKLPL